MCQKGCNIVKQFYAVVLTSQSAAPKCLQVLKYPPNEKLIHQIVATQVVGKIELTPFHYSEKPKLEIIPIHIPVDILY
jgi:hypothetical protein